MSPRRGRVLSRRGKLAVTALLGLLVVLGIAGGVGATWSSFSASTGNSGNTFEAASSFGGGSLRMASGSYTGNGSDNRQITDPGFQPDLVIVKGASTQVSVMRTSTMTGDTTKPLVRPAFGSAALAANLVQSLDAGGFTIGTDARVNTNGTTYYWVAFQADAGALKVGSYGGTGAAQSVSGVGFSPEYVAVLGAGNDEALQRFTGMTRAFQFGSALGVSDGITSLDSGGFSLGVNAGANTNGQTYHYVAFNEVAGTTKVGSYSGTGVNDRTVTGVGFQPDYLMVRANDTATARRGNHRPAAVTGTSSLLFDATNNLTTAIRALQADGFQVGTDASVNANNVPYHYIAFKNTGGGCSLPGTRTLSVSEDSWVNQASPTTNSGSDSVLKVTSKSPSLNTRALVKFNLPAQAADCGLTDAKLRVNNKSPAAGRTIAAYQNASSWTEPAVTWSNQPSTTGSAVNATTPSSAGWMEWTVTAQVQSMYATSNHGFKLQDASENGAGVEQQFDSKEASINRPELILTFG